LPAFLKIANCGMAPTFKLFILYYSFGNIQGRRVFCFILAAKKNTIIAHFNAKMVNK